jgi:hypothetical protein
MQTSGASRREIASAYLELFWLFENLKPVCVRSVPFVAPSNAPVMPGLDPGIHQSSSKVFPKKMDRRVIQREDALLAFAL